MADIVVFGAGGFAREVAVLIGDINAAKPGSWNLLGFIDDSTSTVGRTLVDLPVLGGIEWLSDRRDVAVCLGVGSPVTKRKLAARIAELRLQTPVLIHPNVVWSKFIEVGSGAVITAGNILTVDIEIGDFAMLNLACTVGHDVRVGPFATISPGAKISGNVIIGEGCDIGTGSASIQGIEIGNWSVIGAGAVVTSNIPANSTAVGVPARVVKRRPDGWHEA